MSITTQAQPAAASDDPRDESRPQYIASNATEDAPWHLAVRHEARSAKTGKLFGVYYKTRCSGRTLGGAYGYTRIESIPEHARVCTRCAKL